MNNITSLDLRLMEGRTYIVGREGHIYINDPTVSKNHAELTIINRRIYLRDLNSTNGTYLLKNKNLVHFVEGYVNLLQTIMIGNQKHTIQNLLAIASEYAASDSATTEMNIINKSKANQG